MAATKLRRIDSLSIAETNAHLILIGGPESVFYEEWAFASAPWQAFLDTTSSKIAVLAFDSSLALDESFTWLTVLEEGRELIECLLDLQEKQTTQHVLSFLCHGLGGFVLKQALGTANAQGSRYAMLLGSIVGIVFLGAPHISSNTTSDAATKSAGTIDTSLRILRSTEKKLSSQCLTRAGKEAHCLFDICKCFDDIQLRVPVMTLFETKESRVKYSFKEGKGMARFRPQRCILVNEQAARTFAGQEQYFGLASNHEDLPKLYGITTAQKDRLEQWLLFVYGAKRRDECVRKVELLKEPASPVASLSSLASYDAARKALANDFNETRRAATQTSSMGPTWDTGKSWDMTPLVRSFAPARKQATLPCFMMETVVRNHNFYPRDAILEALDASLLPSETLSFSSEPEDKKSVVLCGLGGLGKTAIAVEFAFTRRHKFDAVFWLRADEPSKLEHDFDKIAGVLGLEDDEELKNPVVSRNLARGWLENPTKVLASDSDIVGQTDARWLLILDNADQPDILQDYRLASSNGSILITSRDPRSRVVPMVASKTIDIPLLEDNQAAEMLRRLSGVSANSRASLQIAQKLGGLPLAISHMAAVIQYQYMSFAELLRSLEDDADRRDLYEYQVAEVNPQARGNVSSIWFVERLKPSPRTMLEICSLLDPDCIQERILEGGIPGLEHLDIFFSSKMSYRDARKDLIQASLVTRNEEKEQFWMHRLLQDTVKTKMSKERTSNIFAAAVVLVKAAWGDTNLVQRHDMTLSKRREGLFPHALSLKSMYEKHDFLRERLTSLQLGALMNEAGWWQHERGNSHDIKSLLGLANEICQLFPGKDSVDLQCDVHYGLAAVANETNDAVACLQHTQELLRIRLEIFSLTGNTDVRLAIAHNEHAIALCMNERFDEAITQFNRSIEVFKTLEEYWPGMDTNPRTNLGATLWNVGRLPEAFATLEEVLRDREAKFGVMDRESYRTGRILFGLGNVSLDQGRLAESEEYHRKALLQWQTVIGNNHHKTADGCLRMAQHCLRRNELESARSFLDQALKVYKLRPSVYKPQIARTLFMQARLETQAGNTDGGATLFREARKLRNEIPWALKKSDIDLRQIDFDTLVMFHSR